MEILTAIAIGALTGASIYCLLRRSVLKFIMGIALLSQSINLLVFTAAGLTQGSPAFIPASQSEIQGVYADPLPQALVLTAIVIGFGLLVFTLALAQRAIQAVGSDDLNDFRNTDS